jgi:hypothetical protein
VIGGPGAFIVVAEDFTAFARAIMNKLLIEIAGIRPSETPARSGCCHLANSITGVRRADQLGAFAGDMPRSHDVLPKY